MRPEVALGEGLQRPASRSTVGHAACTAYQTGASQAAGIPRDARSLLRGRVQASGFRPTRHAAEQAAETVRSAPPSAGGGEARGVNRR